MRGMAPIASLDGVDMFHAFVDQLHQGVAIEVREPFDVNRRLARLVWVRAFRGRSSKPRRPDMM